jgi:tocopherol O-methyltransferase
MIDCPTITSDQIRRHYNLATPFYWLLWGRHVHHGLWNGEESAKAAQQNLIDTLANHAELQKGQDVVDVGCGMGGSSIHLARAFGCHVTGVTVSRVQAGWARWSSRFRGVGNKTEFRCADAEKITFEPESFDLLWSIECTEHLFDKPRFFRRAAQWLRPGGRVAICAWLAGESMDDAAHVQQVYDVCEGFLCPSLGTSDDYAKWLSDAGLTVERREDWTDRVCETWEICRRRVKQSGVRWLARLTGRDDACFLDRFETILNAYRSGAMRYGCFIARLSSHEGAHP